ncbi:hypothetical protein UFOVP2_13 [uncultured Caudovirales phage]|uniref:Uncharacterized protein n=1 Tax=uncultured Caudovirales phage TaxID=2100421 RepID=A0A6J5KH33_9CAUD|nr:hypothetical protein UFOVP2_13 [uncultured Caudovirales phage]
MSKNAAKVAQTKDTNAAEKKLAKAGITKPKHVPKVTPEGEIDTDTNPVVQSGFSAFNQVIPPTTKESKVNGTTTDVGAQIAQAQANKEAAAKAKMEAKAAKNAAAAEKKAAAEAAKLAKKSDSAEAKAAREIKKAEAKAAREAKAAEAKAAGKGYVGSMLALADRVKQGLYVKSATGQLRSTDELAVALDNVPPHNVVALGMAIFAEPNKYAALNVGQQSMNYRNRIRGAIRKGGENAPTLASVVEYVKVHGLDTGPIVVVKAKKAEAEAETV